MSVPTPEEFRAYLLKQGEREYDMNSPCGCALHGYYADERKLEVRVDFKEIVIHGGGDEAWFAARVENTKGTWLQEFQETAIDRTGSPMRSGASLYTADELVKILDEVVK